MLRPAWAIAHVQLLSPDQRKAAVRFSAKNVGIVIAVVEVATASNG
jgi:hypothetical protein